MIILYHQIEIQFSQNAPPPSFQTACREERTLGDLRDAAGDVSRRLTDLLEHIRTGPRRATVTTEERREQQFEQVITSTDKFLTHQGGHPGEMLDQVKNLARATTQLVRFLMMIWFS